VPVPSSAALLFAAVAGFRSRRLVRPFVQSTGHFDPEVLGHGGSLGANEPPGRPRSRSACGFSWRRSHRRRGSAPRGAAHRCRNDVKDEIVGWRRDGLWKAARAGRFWSSAKEQWPCGRARRMASHVRGSFRSPPDEAKIVASPAPGEPAISTKLGSASRFRLDGGRGESSDSGRLKETNLDTSGGRTVGGVALLRVRQRSVPISEERIDELLQGHSTVFRRFLDGHRQRP